MPNIRTVKLQWERRFRGTYPVSRYALHDDGTLTLAAPRPLETRTYDLTRLSLDGSTEICNGFSVETLVKLEVSALANTSLGITSDDLYLFQQGSKQRFLGERHIVYVDVALSQDGQHLFTAFSDMAGASFAIAYGDIGGRVAWTLDMDVPVTSVAIARNGGRVAVGAEHGAIRLLDSGRRYVWEFEQSEPIRALACSSDGVYVAYGTAGGGVGLVDGHGTRQWEVRLPGEVTTLALSGDGRLCAALCRPQKAPHTAILYCITAGQIEWEYDNEQLQVGLSLSANGLYLSTGTRNGTLSVYEIVPGEGQDNPAVSASSEAQARAEELAEAGDLLGACRLLQEALEANPDNVILCKEVQQRRAAYFETEMGKAESQRLAGDHVAAGDTLTALLDNDPLNIEAIRLLTTVRKEQCAELIRHALTFIEGGENVLAERVLLDAIALEPYDALEARHALNELRTRQVEGADQEADLLLAEGKVEAAVAALERAQAVRPTAERAKKMERAQTVMEFAAGMDAYESKRYQEAVFQFKKVLHRDPAHAEAKRYLSFAQKMAQDASTESLNDRFRHLE